MTSHDALVEAARRAQQRAYAPYSQFSVGAAVLTSSGKVYEGANVENASYGLTVCAERTAVFSAVIAGERQFQAIAIATSSEPPSPPCGMCLQVLAEFGLNWVVFLAGPSSQRSAQLSDFLPQPFRFSPDR